MGPDPMTDRGLESEQRWDVKDSQSNRGIEEEVEDKGRMCVARFRLIYRDNMGACTMLGFMKCCFHSLKLFTKAVQL